MAQVETYYYLKDEPLHKDYDLCSPETQEQKCAIVLFSMNIDCRMKVYDSAGLNGELITMPFLKFMVERVSSPDIAMQFPEFTYTCVDTDNSTQLETEAMLAITNKLGLAQRSAEEGTPTLETAYQGFVLHEDVLFMFYNYDVISQYFTHNTTNTTNTTNITNITNNPNNPNLPNEVPTTNTSAYTWAIVDELLFQRQVDGVPVANGITELFRSNPILWNIEYQGANLDYPFCLYGVEEGDTTSPSLVNEHNNGNTNRQTNTPYTKQKQSIGRATELYSLGEEYGEMYLFSNTTIQPNDTNCVKYAVFVSGCKYVLDEIKHNAFIEYMTTATHGMSAPVYGGGIMDYIDVGLDEVAVDEEKDDHGEVSALYYVEPMVDKQIWGVRHSHRFVVL